MHTIQRIFKTRYEEKIRNNLPVFIAEIGLNHNGKLSQAVELIRNAAEAGADMVKFQVFNSEKFYSIYAQSLLNNEPPRKDDTLLHFFKRLELKQDDYAVLQETAVQHDVVFFGSCFDEDSFTLLEKRNVPVYKIASSEITNVPLLQAIASTHKPVIVSTGISLRDEIQYAVDVLRSGGCDIVLLHCVSLYPVSAENVNVMRIKELQKIFTVHVGYSDHSRDSSAGIMAAALNARVFEKHFKLSDDHDCVDKDVSLSPKEFKRYIEDIQLACSMMGDGAIDYKECEAAVARSARRSIYAACDIEIGAIITRQHIAVKRPGTGVSPLRIDELVGKKAKRNILKDMPIGIDDVE